MSVHSGACLCGAVKVIIDAEPQVIMACFCQHCSKGAGGPSQIIAKFDVDKVHIRGHDAIATYTFADTSSGLPKEKAFCKICAVPLWTIPFAAKGKYLILRTAILDTGASLKPQNELFVKNRAHWISPIPGATQWEDMRK